jgi:hypothetical protein
LGLIYIAALFNLSSISDLGKSLRFIFLRNVEIISCLSPNGAGSHTGKPTCRPADKWKYDKANERLCDIETTPDLKHRSLHRPQKKNPYNQITTRDAVNFSQAHAEDEAQ